MPDETVLISLTRLRLKSIRYVPAFAYFSLLSTAQVRRSPGFVAVRFLMDRRLTFWTMTAWRDEASMKAFRGAAAHRRAMPKLKIWCDEASVTRWTGPVAAMADWSAAAAMMAAQGEPSHVQQPSSAQTSRSWAEPRL
jgi:hypothetical protein